MTVFEDLVTFNSLRFLVGVSEVEMSDTDLEESGLGGEVSAEIAGFLPAPVTAESIYTGGIAVDATEDEKLLLVYLGAYSRYYLAAQVLITGRLKFATKISDSQDEMTRAAWDDKEKIRLLMEKANRYKTLLLEALGEEVGVSPAYSLMGISSPTFDPVTG
jgi:hypothetical protein